ncbi:hypothetical protein PIB30_018846 [Stylosanthes scabra]|uniref:Uncharacterized protein n=1 Tax=Stylosanthes scabra TaxID=79078 RepID=A0ABU6T9B0_9FABA|nr:hypothetical protein [Stylosanthes scabra]
MATTRQGNNINKVTDHRISDFSLDSISLSFAGLVSVQDQQQQQLNPTVNNIPNNNHSHNLSGSYKLPEPDFEFATNKGSSEPKNSGAGGVLLISNGQLVPQSSSQPNRSPLNPIPQGTLGTYLATDNHQQQKRPRSRPRPRHHQMSSWMPSGQTGNNPRKYHYEALGKARKHYDEGDDYDNDDDDDDDEKKNKNKKKSLGKKALSSFISPCRDCKAIEPSAVKYSKTQVSKYDE